MATKKAVALRYQKQVDAAPKVVAKGCGAVAERIVQLAQESGVQVWQDQSLAQALFTLEVDTVIPQELYHAVAEILAYIYRARRG